jgi:hypothetical protein
MATDVSKEHTSVIVKGQGFPEFQTLETGVNV